MTTYLIRRLLLLIPTLFGITLLTYVLLRSAGGNAALIKGGGPNAHAITAEARAQMVKLYDLDKPSYIAYFDWLARTGRLDLGKSFVDHRSVAAKIAERLPLTLSLAGSALILSYLIAIPLGVAAPSASSFSCSIRFPTLPPRLCSFLSSPAVIISTCCRCTA
jgi:peptide/nickel transport system permease protein